MPRSPPAPSKHEVDANTKIELARIGERKIARIIDAALGIGKTALRVAGWCFVAYCTKEAVFSIAGRSTSFSAIVGAAFSMSADRYAAYALAAISTGTAVYQRKLRRKANKELGSHILKLEEKLDPRRSSSGLMPDGRPKQEDLDDA